MTGLADLRPGQANDSNGPFHLSSRRSPLITPGHLQPPKGQTRGPVFQPGRV